MRFDERLKFYLDQKTKDHLFEMAAKERLQLETIKNLALEIKQRGATGASRDQAGFNVIYGDMQRMVADYSAELDAILAILDEIQALSQTLDQEKRHELLEQFGDLKDRLVAVIDSRTIYKKSMGTTTYKTSLMREYNVEVDSLLRMYNRLEKFERTASTRSDTSAVRLAREQKQKLQTILATVQSETGVAPKVSSAYLSEVDEILKLLTELDKLERPSARRSLDTAIAAEQLRRELVRHLDRNLMALLGISGPAGNRPTLEETFQTWRVNQFATHETRRMKYAIVKKNLLETGTVKERSRMLNRDLMDALLNYASERYEVADLQLAMIMADYRPYFSNWEAVQFYRTECLYARGIFAEASTAFEQLLRDYPAGKFRATALLRLLTMAQHLNQVEAFFSYYRQLESLSPAPAEKMLERARYLAGYYQLKLGHYGAADSTLRLISGPKTMAGGGKYAQAARYLRGIAQANRGNLNSAMASFKEAAGSEALPWSGVQQTSIRNHALLRMGYLHYERGEYADASKYFDQVSRGAEQHEQSMLGKAWALVKQDSVGRAVTQLRTLTQGNLVSDYVYEALVLSAHCKRLLSQPQAAMRDLRYVTSARGILELSRDYNEERNQIVAQMNELDRMEREALEHQDQSLYDLVSKARQSLQATLVNFNYRGQQGNLRSEEYAEERRNILNQLHQLDEVIANAQTMGLEEVLQEAVSRRNRLIKALEAYRADQSLEAVNYIVEYPLAIKESGVQYRREVIANLAAHLASEQERVRANIDSLRALTAMSGNGATALDLKVLQEDFNNLKHRVDRFQTWLASYKVEAARSNFDQWADYSGFELSDLAFEEIEQREQKIASASMNLSSIESLLEARKTDLESFLRQIDAEMKRIEEEIVEEQIRLDKLEHEKYFENVYFDKAEAESGVEKTEEKAGRQPLPNGIEKLLREN
ncbi:MAG: hypothetical protein ACREOO_04365 [bacterium]